MFRIFGDYIRSRIMGYCEEPWLKEYPLYSLSRTRNSTNGSYSVVGCAKTPCCCCVTSFRSHELCATLFLVDKGFNLKEIFTAEGSHIYLERFWAPNLSRSNMDLLSIPVTPKDFPLPNRPITCAFCKIINPDLAGIRISSRGGERQAVIGQLGLSACQ